MKKHFSFVHLFISCTLMLLAISAFGQDGDVEPVVGLVASSKLAWMSSALAIILQLSKSEMLGGLFAKIDKAYQPAVVLLIGQLAGLVDTLISGEPFSKAAIEWLLASGNAMALYAVIVKPFTKKNA